MEQRSLSQPAIGRSTALARTDSPPLSQLVWNALGWEDKAPFKVAERDEIVAGLPSAIAFAEQQLAPCSDVERAAAVGVLLSMPAAKVDEGITGDAILAGYDIALDDVPLDLLRLAVRRALRDTSRVFRPGPPELRAYIEGHLAERERRLQRLRNIEEAERKRATEPLALPEPPPTPEMFDEFYARMGGRPSSREPKRVDYANLRMPTVEDYVAHGLSREAAEQAVADFGKPLPPMAPRVEVEPEPEPAPTGRRDRVRRRRRAKSVGELVAKPFDPEKWPHAGKSWDDVVDEIDGTGTTPQQQGRAAA